MSVADTPTGVDPHDGPPVDRGSDEGSGSVARWVWMVAGALLMALAVWIALRRGGMESALDSLRQAGALTVLALFALPIASWLLTATLFWALTRRFGRVRWTEMTALIAASWLLNNLPMRPGMVGRVAYHRLVNAIPVLASVRVLVEPLLRSAVAGAVCVVIVAVIAGDVVAALAVAGVAVLGAFVGLAVLKRRQTPLPVSLLLIGTGLRLADIAGWL